MRRYPRRDPVSLGSAVSLCSTTGMEGPAAGYEFHMRIVRDKPDDLRSEVGQSLVLLGLAAVIVVVGLMLGVAF